MPKPKEIETVASNARWDRYQRDGSGDSDELPPPRFDEYEVGLLTVQRMTWPEKPETMAFRVLRTATLAILFDYVDYNVTGISERKLKAVLTEQKELDAYAEAQR